MTMQKTEQICRKEKKNGKRYHMELQITAVLYFDQVEDICRKKFKYAAMKMLEKRTFVVDVKEQQFFDKNVTHVISSRPNFWSRKNYVTDKKTSMKDAVTEKPQLRSTRGNNMLALASEIGTQQQTQFDKDKQWTRKTRHTSSDVAVSDVLRTLFVDYEMELISCDGTIIA